MEIFQEPLTKTKESTNKLQLLYIRIGERVLKDETHLQLYLKWRLIKIEIFRKTIIRFSYEAIKETIDYYNTHLTIDNISLGSLQSIKLLDSNMWASNITKGYFN